MTKIDLSAYYKNFFQQHDQSKEIFKEINRTHAISSLYYDVQLGRKSLHYRDIATEAIIQIEHELSHVVVIYLDQFLSDNRCDIAVNTLKERIAAALSFLKIKYVFA